MRYFPSLLAIAILAPSPMTDAGMAFAKGCPPGLAKKNPPCVPPGKAKQGVASEEWTERDRVGHVVERDDLIYLDDFARYDLRPLPYGQRYAIVDDQIVVIDAQSYQILKLIQAFTGLGN